jgi:hypothetical protein
MKKRIILIISILLVITAAIACIYVFSRPKVESGTFLLRTGSGDKTIRFSELPLSNVSGETINKKGKTKKIDAKGYSLSDIPALTGISDYSDIIVFSDDEYNAEVSKDELSDHDKAWLINDDGGIRLIVFKDEDSKRNVKNVVRIEIR